MQIPYLIMPVKLTNEEDQNDMKRKWISIRIDEELEKRLCDYGKFKQSYNDVIAQILNELETLKEKKR